MRLFKQTKKRLQIPPHFVMKRLQEIRPCDGAQNRGSLRSGTYLYGIPAAIGLRKHEGPSQNSSGSWSIQQYRGCPNYKATSYIITAQHDDTRTAARAAYCTVQ